MPNNYNPYSPYRFRTYTVKPGANLSSIAKEFGITSDELLKANPGAFPLSTGQGIKIPAPFTYNENFPKIVQGAQPQYLDVQLASSLKGLPTLAQLNTAVSDALGGNRPGRGYYRPATTLGAQPTSQTATTQAAPVGPANVNYDASKIDRTSGGRVDAVTGFSNQAGNSEKITVGYDENYNPIERNVVMTRDDMERWALQNFKPAVDKNNPNTLRELESFAQSAGYVKFGGTWVYVPGEVQTPKPGQAAPGTRGNRSGNAVRNWKGTLLNLKRKKQAGSQATPQQTETASTNQNLNASTG